VRVRIGRTNHSVVNTDAPIRLPFVQPVDVTDALLGLALREIQSLRWRPMVRLDLLNRTSSKPNSNNCERRQSCQRYAAGLRYRAHGRAAAATSIRQIID